MVPRLALLFIVVPILELAILVQLGRNVGFWPTLALVLVTGFLGASLTRTAGMRLVRSIQAELNSGRLPSQSLMDGLAILCAGALLLTPGLITDVLAFALLFTPSRRWIQARARKWLERQMVTGRMQVGVFGPSGVTYPGGERRGGARSLDPRHEIEQRPRE